MSVVVNVMLSLMSVMSPAHSCVVQPIGAHCCEVMYVGCFGFRGELGFLNCDDVCMCVVNKQFELLEFCSGRCGWRGGEWISELGLGFFQSCEDRGSVEHVSVFCCGGLGGVGGE